VPSVTAFDVREIPFARRGSWINLSPVIGLHERADDVHVVSHQTGLHPVFAFVPLQNGERADAVLTASASVLTWSAGEGAIHAAFDTDDTIRVRGTGLDLRLVEASSALTPFTGTYLITDPVDGALVLTSYETGRRYRITVLAGHATIVGDGALGTAERSVELTGPVWEIAIEEFETAREPYVTARSFDDIRREVQAEFDTYCRALVPGDAGLAASTAAYVMWSATVRPGGFVGREAILMSKHWMDKVWSWDHCFNALALAQSDPEAALDQFLLPFDHQDASGALPDSVAHSEILYNFVKPPIHGWAFERIRERASAPYSTDRLREVYERLSDWTRFWLDSRRAPGRTLPYYQHGNDSGWDNSTMFDRSRVVEAPDLAAFLVIQLHALDSLARELGIEGAPWADTARQVEDALFSELWTGEQFVARTVADRGTSSVTSLLTTLPIILGDRLPRDVADRLAHHIRAHLTEWGPATELVDSPHYESDGYWRGPIWAPSTFLIEDGLRRAGFTELADTVSARFRLLCETSGFAENFDAITGAGLRDRAYTWTASAYLVLHAAFIGREAGTE
jgi:hypothetical protein